MRFYKLGEESDQEVISYDNKRVEITNLKEKEKQDNEYSKAVNQGLKNILDKDTEQLSNELSEINKKILVSLSTNNIPCVNELNNRIENIDETLVQVENLIGDAIIAKSKIRVGLFSTKKAEKKERVYSLEELIEFLTKCQNDIIALKDEYNKLESRKEKVKGAPIKEDSKAAPSLEHTISFYLKQKEER